MCKLASVADINDQNREKVWQFMQILGKIISLGNSDGLGYAAFDSKGNLFGERWLINETAFRDLSQIKGINANKMNNIYSFFGDKVNRSDAKAIIFHTRAATCGKGIKNTHPFVNNTDNPETAIIHNGIIYNDYEFKKVTSTCDSEVLAHLYHENNVNKDLKHLNKFVPLLKGWFTVMNLSKDVSGRMVMDVYSDNGRLSSYFIQELGTRVYSSRARDIEQVAKMLGYTVTNVEHMERNTAFRVDVLTGKILNEVLLSEPVDELNEHFPWDGANVVDMTKMTDEEFKKGYWKRD